MGNKPIRIVIDTNLWISFLLSKDFSKLDRLVSKKKVCFLFSQELLDEFVEVAKRPKFKAYFSQSDVHDILSSIDEVAEFVDIKSSINRCRDAKDNFLLSLAVDGQADFLITGDKDLLDIKKIDNTSIITLSDYI